MPIKFLFLGGGGVFGVFGGWSGVPIFILKIWTWGFFLKMLHFGLQSPWFWYLGDMFLVFSGYFLGGQEFPAGASFSSIS